VTHRVIAFYRIISKNKNVARTLRNGERERSNPMHHRTVTNCYYILKKREGSTVPYCTVPYPIKESIEFGRIDTVH